MPEVKVVNVSKRFGGGKIVAVDNVSLQIFCAKYRIAFK